ncbi:sodium/solute symporter [Nesterenkonia flava]|uniref:Cation acetate symporter n=1 Tax=Nesterenkonia flava TaxID=469799 RepID=A0ABU1FR39_9MICC|nr:cation acetate symporter [Nesterenkonia flava]MDR5711115.1 cation acetate symporter [Nesterenkonia flava]
MTVAAVVVVCLVTVLVSLFGLRVARSTRDFYVASRRVSPRMNASALAGEYISAASFLGVAGLIVAEGSYGLWYPLGYTAGCLTMLLFMTGPLRRSGAYTVPDFVSLRFSSSRLRVLTVMLVVLTGWLYIIPQLHGAALVASTAAGLPPWAGPVIVVLVVMATVMPGGMRSVTIAQAVQYWIKFCALLVPLVFILLQLGLLEPGTLANGQRPDFSAVWQEETAGAATEFYRTVSLILALMLGTIGLPHVLVRFYTNPDGDAARRTTFLLLVLLTGFYVLPVALGVIARGVLTQEADLGSPDSALLQLPGAVFAGAGADVLTAVVAGGAFAAFLSTTSGLVVSVSGVLSQEFFGGTVRGFRIGAVLAGALPLALATATTHVPLAGAVAMVFTFTASSLAPLLLLGIWWSKITAQGAVAGMVTGAAASLGSLGLALVLGSRTPGGEATVQADGALVLLQYPAPWCVPLAFAVTVLVSRLGTGKPPANTERVLARLHLPENP